jgi:uncharacterized membrane protein
MLLGGFLSWAVFGVKIQARHARHRTTTYFQKVSASVP